MRTHYYLVPLLCVIATSSIAETYPSTEFIGEFDKNEAWVRQCMTVKDITIPKDEMLRPPTERFSAGCSTIQYYVVKGSSPTQRDWENVRDCALQSGNAAVLMMLYANGYGVKKNLQIATHYACKTAGALSEMQSRVERLASGDFTQRGAFSEVFDLCDDTTSGMLQAECSQYKRFELDANNKGWLSRYVSTLSPESRSKLAQLESAAATLGELRSRSEVSPMGSGSAAMQILTQAEETELLYKDLQQLEEGKAIEFSKASFAAADTELNEVYRAIMAINSNDPNSSFGMLQMSPTGVREAQRSWVKYRDAWLAYLKMRYPKVAIENWKTLLTERRVVQLRDLL